MFDEEILRSIMMTCIILYNMIVEDEYDYDAGDVYEPDPMNTALTRIYERPMGPNGEPFEPEPGHMACIHRHGFPIRLLHIFFAQILLFSCTLGLNCHLHILAFLLHFNSYGLLPYNFLQKL
ncbi:unnamed protein product [Prunus brigantina]